jgi:hypothetical protein
MWRGVRVGAKFIYNGFVMLAATTTMNFNVSNGVAHVWRQWTADHDDR